MSSIGFEKGPVRVLCFFFGGEGCSYLVRTLPETNIFAPENGCLEDDRFLFGVLAYFQGRLLLVSGNVSFQMCFKCSNPLCKWSWILGGLKHLLTKGDAKVELFVNMIFRVNTF